MNGEQAMQTFFFPAVSAQLTKLQPMCLRRTNWIWQLQLDKLLPAFVSSGEYPTQVSRSKMARSEMMDAPPPRCTDCLNVLIYSRILFLTHRSLVLVPVKLGLLPYTPTIHNVWKVNIFINNSIVCYARWSITCSIRSVRVVSRAAPESGSRQHGWDCLPIYTPYS